MQMPNWMPEPGSPLDRAATFVMANLVFIACSMLVITLPAALAALFAVMAPWVRGRDVEFFSTFFSAMRRHWLKSMIIGVGDAVIAVILYVNLNALNLMGIDNPLTLVIGSVNFLVGLTVLLTNLYIWPLLVLFDLPLRRLLTISARMAIGHLFWSALILAVAVVLLGISLFIPPFISILTVFSAIALLVNWGTWRIIRRYATPEEIAELDYP